ncbi:MAG TPA: Crp/Fnr family transcriptional regulator [Thermoanaerobaculia bacterium]|nr:Crp/Fnr family transcriptional regulator [Thermoanaerobaculia bacterium]HUM30789.1 Crp/Fnr family transcriptional regulator [Thermoanaerobaculia bacterium]HXK69011.1 Crp/Fnr family transcriptional regulator [Thermoanaerobaculia bacterium]
MEHRELFKNVTLFSNLSDEATQRIARTAVKSSYNTGEVVVWEKDSADVFFVIVQGRVSVSKMTADGREIMLSQLKKGDFFGEMALLIDEPRTATVTTLSPTTVLKVYRRDFISIVRNDAEVASSILKEVCSRLANANALIESLVYIDVCGRLAGYLRKLARAGGTATPEGMIQVTRPTQLEIAHAIGTTRETVNRMLKELQRQGLIRAEGKKILLRNEDVERD